MTAGKNPKDRTRFELVYHDLDAIDTTRDWPDERLKWERGNRGLRENWRSGDERDQ